MGGELELISMDGYGTDAYIYLKKSAEDAGEILPEYDAQQLQHYSTETQMNDWWDVSFRKERAAAQAAT
jgi:hypothetical protein